MDNYYDAKPLSKPNKHRKTQSVSIGSFVESLESASPLQDFSMMGNKNKKIGHGNRGRSSSDIITNKLVDEVTLGVKSVPQAKKIFGISSEKLEELFLAICNENKIVTMHSLVSAITSKGKARLFHNIFGYKSTSNIVYSFHILDFTKTGDVTLEEFIERAPLAFSSKNMEAKKVNDYEIAEPLELSEIPEPPPMTRELLYRAVFNEVDTANSNNQKDGYITLNKLVNTLNKKRNSIKEVFGTGSEIALNAFSAMDKDGSGKISFDDFFNNCESAFVPVNVNDVVLEEKPLTEVAEPLGTSTIPDAPAMSRDFLFRAVFNSIDVNRKSFFTQLELVKSIKKKNSILSEIFGIPSEKSGLVAFQAFSKMDTTGNGRVTFTEFFEQVDTAFNIPTEEIIVEEETSTTSKSEEPSKTTRRGSLGR